MEKSVSLCVRLCMMGAKEVKCKIISTPTKHCLPFVLNNRAVALPV